MGTNMAKNGEDTTQRDDDRKGKDDSSELTERLGKHVTSSFLAGAINRIFSLLLVKGLALILVKSNFGLYNLWYSFTLLLATLCTSSFSATLWRFLQANELKRGKRASLLSTAAAASLSLSAVGSFILFILYIAKGFTIAQDPFYLSSLGVVSLLVVSYILRELVLVTSGTEQSHREVLIFNVLFSIGSFSAAIALTLLFHDFRATIIGSFVGLTIPAISALYYKIKKYGYFNPSSAMLKKSLHYGSSLMVVTTVNSSVSFFVSYFVGAYVEFSVVAVLAVALTVSSIVGFVVRAPLPAYNAFLVNSYESDFFERSNTVTVKIIEIFISFGTILLVLVLSAAPMVVTLVASETYLDAIPLLPFTVSSTLLLSFSAIWKYRLFLKEKTNLVGAVYSLSLLILVISCILMIPLYGSVGAGIALVLQSLTVLVSIILLAQRNLPLSMSKVFFVKWLLALFSMGIAWKILSLIGIPTLVTGLLTCGLFLAIMLITRAHRLEDIEQMIYLLLLAVRG